MMCTLILFIQAIFDVTFTHPLVIFRAVVVPTYVLDSPYSHDDANQSDVCVFPEALHAILIHSPIWEEVEGTSLSMV